MVRAAQRLEIGILFEADMFVMQVMAFVGLGSAAGSFTADCTDTNLRSRFRFQRMLSR